MTNKNMFHYKYLYISFMIHLFFVCNNTKHPGLIELKNDKRLTGQEEI